MPCAGTSSSRVQMPGVGNGGWRGQRLAAPVRDKVHVERQRQLLAAGRGHGDAMAVPKVDRELAGRN